MTGVNPDWSPSIADWSPAIADWGASAPPPPSGGGHQRPPRPMRVSIDLEPDREEAALLVAILRHRFRL